MFYVEEGIRCPRRFISASVEASIMTCSQDLSNIGGGEEENQYDVCCSGLSLSPAFYRAAWERKWMKG